METNERPSDGSQPSGPIDRVSRGVGAVASYFYLVIVAITAYEVVMRYVLLQPTIWVHDLAVALCALGFVFGGPVALSARQHIAITAFYERTSGRVRRRLDIINSLLSVLYLTVLVWATYLLAVPAVATHEMTGTAWNVPIPMILKVSLLAGAVLMLLQAVSNLINDMRAACRD